MWLMGKHVVDGRPSLLHKKEKSANKIFCLLLLLVVGKEFVRRATINDFQIGDILTLVASCSLERMIKRARLEHSGSGHTMVDLVEELTSKIGTF
ncbi:hypothetical protein A2U01_0012611 [Trifolium medium]|uniref:Uncharacterized protein n=1 Tax=Trifolium medium TaxID=97028 RepID=A0A392MWJ9_9FABA|nr:hypothetical protein [Trifolium medium]